MAGSIKLFTTLIYVLNNEQSSTRSLVAADQVLCSWVYLT